MGTVCGLDGKAPRELRQKQKGNMQQPLTNSFTPRNTRARVLSEHIHTDADISDSEKMRLYMERSWNKYWPTHVSQYSKMRTKFLCIQTLCKQFKFQKVENTEKRMYGNNELECHSIDALFNLNFRASYHGQKLDFLASIQFKDTFSIFEDNQFDTNNSKWKQNLSLLNENMNSLRRQFILKSMGFRNSYSNKQIGNILIQYLPSVTEQEIFVIKNDGKIDKNVCFLIQSLYDISVDENDLIFECFGLFWEWFVSKELLQLKNKNTVTYKSYQSIIESTPKSETNRNSIGTKPENESKGNVSEITDDNDKSLSSNVGNMSQRDIVDTMGGMNDENTYEFELGMSQEIKTVSVEEMKSGTKQFYNFLSKNGLEQYFPKFQKENCSDIGFIEDLMDNEYFLQNEIGMKNKVHRGKFIRECEILKAQMNAFQRLLSSSLLFEKLSKKYGIISVNMLCAEVRTKSDLRDKFEISDENQSDVLWGIIQNQLHPIQIEHPYSTEGAQNASTVKVNRQEFPGQFI